MNDDRRRKRPSTAIKEELGEKLDQRKTEAELQDEKSRSENF